MQEIFEKRQNVDYNLRFQTDFVLPGVNTTYFGLHSLRYFSSKIWNVILDGNPVVANFLQTFMPTAENCSFV